MLAAFYVCFVLALISVMVGVIGSVRDIPRKVYDLGVVAAVLAVTAFAVGCVLGLAGC